MVFTSGHRFVLLWRQKDGHRSGLQEYQQSSHRLSYKDEPVRFTRELKRYTEFQLRPSLKRSARLYV